MSPREAVMLTSVVQAYFPSQPISEFTPDALHELLEPYSLVDCKAAVQARAMRLVNTEGVKWCAPTDVYAEVRRMRAKAIATDMDLELPPHDPDDPQDYIRALKESQQASLAGDPIQPTGLVRRSLRELGGPVRRVSELDAETNAAHAERTKQIHRDNAVRPKHRRDVQPTPAVVFACEYTDGETTCGQPATKTTPDRRRPACDVHAEPSPDTRAATSHDTEGAHT